MKYLVVFSNCCENIKSLYPDYNIWDLRREYARPTGDNSGSEISDFEFAINFLIDKGWKVSGGVSAMSPGNKSYMIQAMVRE